MSFLKHKNERFAAGISFVTVLLLFWAVTFFGLPHKKDQEAYGVTLALGNMDFGSGKIPEMPESTPPQKTTPMPETLEHPQEDIPTAPKIQEQKMTAEKSDVVIHKKKPKKKKKPQKTVRKIKSTPQKNKVKSKTKKTPPQKPSKATQNLLSSLLNTSSKKTGGHGNDSNKGSKGKINGVKGAKNYKGILGSGSNGKYYKLSGRKVVLRPIFKPNCNEEGRVCVQIQVDTSGRVFSATAGVKGSTTMTPCLLEAARKSALQTRWNADKKAPHRQIGLIVYDFILSR